MMINKKYCLMGFLFTMMPHRCDGYVVNSSTLRYWACIKLTDWRSNNKKVRGTTNNVEGYPWKYYGTNMRKQTKRIIYLWRNQPKYTPARKADKDDLE